MFEICEISINEGAAFLFSIYIIKVTKVSPITSLNIYGFGKWVSQIRRAGYQGIGQDLDITCPFFQF